MADPAPRDEHADAEALADEAAAHNRDPQTRREAFELELIEHDESEAGEAVEVDS